MLKIFQATTLKLQDGVEKLRRADMREYHDLVILEMYVDSKYLNVLNFLWI
jgi:hypothetical protein